MNPFGNMSTVPTSPRTSLTASNAGPRKLGSTSGTGQCLTSDASQGAKSGQMSITRMC